MLRDKKGDVSTEMRCQGHKSGNLEKDELNCGKTESAQLAHEMKSD